MSWEVSTLAVSFGRCPVCYTRLIKVLCKCIKGGFFTRPKYRTKYEYCSDCGNHGFTRQCPLQWMHNILENKNDIK